MSGIRGQLLPAGEVATLFNGMAQEYDQISDLWYAWLFCRLHYFLLKDLSRSGMSPGGRGLDVGCGTGFQSMLLNLCGWDVEGVDVALDLVEQARRKTAEDYLLKALFNAPFSFSGRYAKMIHEMSRSYRGKERLGKSEFKVADATQLPYADAAFEVVNCSGSTLSFIDDYLRAMREMVRVLKPGGLLFLELENKYAPDLYWSILSGKLLHNRMGYEHLTWDSAINRLEHATIEYPFSTKTGQVTMPIRLFSSTRFLAEASSMGLKFVKSRSIHCITNLIPSVYLDAPKPGPALTAAFQFLCTIEECVSCCPIFRRLGCSLVLTARKS